MLLDKYQRLNENMKNIDYYAEFGDFWQIKYIKNLFHLKEYHK